MKPAVGTPPTLEWISADKLAVDEAYQRATDSSKSRRLIYSMKEEWDWRLCQPLVISRRADGSLFVIDGQHRLSAALLREDIPHLPCVVMQGQSGEDEARNFVSINTKRQRLSQPDIFNAMLAAGDVVAIATAKLLEETGWTILRGSTAKEPGQLRCAPMIARMVKRKGEAVVRNALTALREAYDVPVTNSSGMIKALIIIFERKEGPRDPDLLIETLSQCEPEDWLLEGTDLRRTNPNVTSRFEGAAISILETYRAALAERAG